MRAPGLGFRLGGAADLQQAILHGARVPEDFQSSRFALLGDLAQAAGEHANGVSQQGAVSWVVHVAFNHSGVHAESLSLRDALFAGDADDPPQHLLGDVGTE